jgi:hypothetical protein
MLLLLLLLLLTALNLQRSNLSVHTPHALNYHI